MARRALAATAVAAVLGGGACANPGPAGPEYRFFAQPRRDDAWFDRVVAWQERTRRDRAGPPAFAQESAGPGLDRGSLQENIGAFTRDERRELARRINAWVQGQTPFFYRKEEDVATGRDHWPTYDELIANNGDDCDGLDLITYELMLEFRFPADEIYRAIVKRDSDGVNHMVTLWFEDRDDPWILDATGAAVRRMIRFSELRGWTPTKVFNETTQFSVVALPHP